jgi:hypothetical protein
MKQTKKMPKWEIDLRAKLEKELPDGHYQMGVGKFQFEIGKGVKIEFEVAMQKVIHQRKKDFASDVVFGQQYIGYYRSSGLAQADIEKILEEMNNEKKE